jgi:transcriptional regulator with AAA-type ATPase domain
MPEKSHKKREAPVSYRPPAALRDEFFARVEKSGLSTCAYLTNAVFGQAASRRARRPAAEEKQLARLLAQTASLRAQLDEIRTAQPEQKAALVDRATEELMLIRASLLRAMGRAP